MPMPGLHPQSGIHWGMCSLGIGIFKNFLDDPDVQPTSSCTSQSVVPGPAAAASPGSL